MSRALSVRRSQRIQNNPSTCSFHQRQPDLEKVVEENNQKALCGMIAFNNALHQPVLAYEDCFAMAMRWTKAKHKRDPVLTEVADNAGRGAFHIQILHAVLFQKGFEVINCLRQSLIAASSLKDMQALFDLKPCILFTAVNHAVTLCEKGNFHDPDCEIYRRLRSPEDLKDALEPFEGVRVVYKIKRLPLRFVSAMSAEATTKRKRKPGHRGGRSRKRSRNISKDEIGESLRA